MIETVEVYEANGKNIDEVAADVWATYTGDMDPVEFLNGQDIEEAVAGFVEDYPQTGYRLPTAVTDYGYEYSVEELLTRYLEGSIE